MHSTALTAALIACLFDVSSCQLDCAYPAKRDIANVISKVIRSGDASSVPQIYVVSYRAVCLAYSQERGRYRAFSALVEYACVGHSECPTGAVTEQFESSCLNGEWHHIVRGSSDNTRTRSPTANSSTILREDCAYCLSPALASSVGVGPSNAPDPVTHCIACVGCSESVGQNRCTGITLRTCCNVYVNDMCDTTCPAAGIFVVDSNSFSCVEICPALGRVENSNIIYSRHILDKERGYCEGTTATVVCHSGYTGGGEVFCRDGNWTSTLPCCEIMDCGDPPHLENGKITVSSSTMKTVFNSVVTYECTAGYEFRKRTITSRTCLSSGDWSEEEILCVIDCGVLEDPVNGRVSYSETVLNSTATYSCTTGYTLTGDDGLRTCLDDGVWSGTQPKCTVYTCNKTALKATTSFFVILSIILAVALVISLFALYKLRRGCVIIIKYSDEVISMGVNGAHRKEPQGGNELGGTVSRCISPACSYLSDSDHSPPALPVDTKEDTTIELYDKVNQVDDGPVELYDDVDNAYAKINPLPYSYDTETSSQRESGYLSQNVHIALTLGRANPGAHHSENDVYTISKQAVSNSPDNVRVDRSDDSENEAASTVSKQAISPSPEPAHTRVDVAGNDSENDSLTLTKQPIPPSPDHSESISIDGARYDSENDISKRPISPSPTSSDDDSEPVHEPSRVDALSDEGEHETYTDPIQASSLSPPTTYDSEHVPSLDVPCHEEKSMQPRSASPTITNVPAPTSAISLVREMIQVFESHLHPNLNAVKPD